MEGIEKHRRLQAVLAALGLGGITIWPLLFRSGTPAFQHDWLWPAFRSQCGAYSLIGALPWTSTSSGMPATYPEPWWPYAAGGAACFVGGPHGGLILYILCCVVISALTMYALCRTAGIAHLPALASQCIYAINPVVLNEIQAGHLLFTASYSLMPLAAALSIRRIIRQQWLLLGVILGLASAQQQFFVFAILLSCALGLATSFRWFVSVILPAVAVCVLFTATQWLGLLIGSHEIFVTIYVLQHWEVAQSSPPDLAARMLGYIGGYADSLIPAALRLALWIVPALSVIGVAGNRHSRLAQISAALGLVAFLLVMGLYGPLALPLSWVFAHLRASAFFRELYDFSALLALSYAILTGFALHRMLSSLKWLGIIAASLLITVSACIASRALVNVPLFMPSTEAQAIARVIASNKAPARYITRPARMPQTLSNYEKSGLPPFVLALGQTSTALSPAAEFPNSYVADALDSTDRTCGVCKVLGIKYIITVPDVRLNPNPEPSLRGLVRYRSTSFKKWQLTTIRGSSILSVVPASAYPSTMSKYTADSDIRTVQGGTPIDLSEFITKPDPRTSWAATSAWSTLPGWLYALRSGIFTLSNERPLHIPSSMLVAGSEDGRLSATSCKTLESLDAHFRVLACGANPLLHGKPPLVVSQAVIGGKLAEPRAVTGSYGSVSTLFALPFWYRLHVKASAGSLLVLREKYDPAWQAGLDARHTEVDGYANGWVLNGDTDRDVDVFYKGSIPYYLLLLLSILLFILAARAVLVACTQFSRSPANYAVEDAL